MLAGLQQLAVAPAKLVQLLNATNMLALFAIAEAEAVLFCGVSDQHMRESQKCRILMAFYYTDIADTSFLPRPYCGLKSSPVRRLRGTSLIMGKAPRLSRLR